MKRALVIGANSLIAQSLISLLQDHQVVSLSRENCDYSEQALLQISAQQAALGGFDKIVCCIGVLHGDGLAPEKRLRDLNEEALQRYFRINTILPALCLKHFAPLLEKNRPSVFAVLSAMVGSIKDNRLGGWYGYRSSKAALNMMVKTAAIEMARSHKQSAIVAIHPGTTQTPLSEPFAANVAEDKYFSPSQSASRILAVVDSVSPEQTGGFFNWGGQPLVW